MIDKYRQYANVCAHTDYGDKKSVRQHNQAARGMIRIVEKAAQEGVDAIARLFPLLDEPLCAEWLAFQLLKREEVTTEVKAKCLKKIESIASGNGPEALGAQMWLKEWKQQASNKEDAPDLEAVR